MKEKTFYPCIFFHPWSKWTQEPKGEITRVGKDDEIIGYYITQTRTCENCGKLESETIRQNIIKN